MKNLVRYLAFVLMVGCACAQSNLPPCSTDGEFKILSNPAYWNNCFGATDILGDKFKGDKYVGEFKDGKFHGEGKYHHLNGNTYIGEYKLGLRNGQGTLTSREGWRYTGEFKDGMLNGSGTFTFANGNIYVGEFKDGVNSGQGTLYHLADNQFKGDKYVGEFKNGKYNGQGTYFHLANNQNKGGKYVGEFKDGKYEGKGTEYAQDGLVRNQGIWANHNLIRSESLQQAISPNTNLPACQGVVIKWSDCVGTMVYPNGAKHTGEFRYGEKFGRGIEYDHRGAVSRDGYWNDYRFFKDIDAFQIALGEKKSPQPTSELERLRAEAEEAKRKQSELEAQLKLAQQPVTQQSSPSNIAPRNSKRIALVIGNAAYNSAPLKNPLNDATDISLALRQSGFEVIDQRNATLQEMTRGIREFGDKLLKSDVGLVYYSGHGLEVKGRNYLLPVNASMIREDEIAFQAIDANLILEKMNTANKSVNILIVDACRDNPFARSFRSTNRGLAQMDAPTGTIVSFSTAPGKTASDGDGRNSPFTKNLVRAMMRADMPIEAMFKEVRKSVVEETKGQQTPWESSSLIGDFYFKVSK